MNSLFFLIGYRAVGKTTIGRLLADELGLRFEDTDKLVEQRAGKTIASIVDEVGWDGFRKIEKEVLAASAGLKGCLVSTGGGAVLHDDIWPKIKQSAGVIWLRAEPGVILSRLRQDHNTTSQRPSLSGKSVYAETEKILHERTPLYSALADYVADTDTMRVDEAVSVLAGWCREYTIQSGDE